MKVFETYIPLHIMFSKHTISNTIPIQSMITIVQITLLRMTVTLRTTMLLMIAAMRATLEEATTMMITSMQVAD